MEETIVSFGVAKLAKEKGFKLQSNPFGYITKFYNHNTKTLLAYGRTGRTDLSKAYYAPTQSLLQRWLREEHNCHVEVLCHSPLDLSTITKENLKFSVGVNYYGENFDSPLEEEADYFEFDIESYEIALGQGLYQALKLIKCKG